jgi:hypothetical protein
MKTSRPITVMKKETEHEYGSAHEHRCTRDIWDRIEDLGGEIRGLGKRIAGYKVLHTTNLKKPERIINHPIPTLRGGAGAPASPSSFSNSYTSLGTDFDRIYTQLISNTFAPSHQPPPAYTQAWISIASILELRNAYLETQLAEYKEMYASAMQDVEWNVGMCARLEEELESREAEDGNKAQQERTNLQSLRIPNPVEQMAENHLALYPPSFMFYPSRSLIVTLGLPAQTLQFAPGTTLRQIHDILAQPHNEYLEEYPAARIVHDILATRKSMGITLPDGLCDEVVCICIPEKCGGVDDEVQIAAWETGGEWGKEEDEVVIEENVDEDDWGSHFEQFFSDFEWNGKGDGEEGTSVCSCTACAEEMGSGNKSDLRGSLGISVREAGKEPEDDGSDGEYCRCDSDSDSHDGDEVHHEDEAPSPWGETMRPRWDSTRFLAPLDDEKPATNHCPRHTSLGPKLTHQKNMPDSTGSRFPF